MKKFTKFLAKQEKERRLKKDTKKMQRKKMKRNG